MQVRLRRRQLDAVPGELDRRLEQARARAAVPYARCAASRPGRRARARRTRPAPIRKTWRRRRRRSRRRSTPSRAARGPGQPEPGRGDEEVEQPVASGRAARWTSMKPPAARAGQRALGDPGRERGGDARVDGVPALGEDRAPASAVSGCPAAIAPLMSRSLVRGFGQTAVDRVAFQLVNRAQPPHAGGFARSRGRRQPRRRSSLARPRPAATSPPTCTSAPSSCMTASGSGTTSGTRAATASSRTASSTTRSRRCSASAARRRDRSPPRRSRSRSSSAASGGRSRAGRTARSPSSGPGSCISARSRSRSGSRSPCSRSGRCRRGKRWRFALLARARARGEPARLPAARRRPRGRRARRARARPQRCSCPLVTLGVARSGRTRARCALFPTAAVTRSRLRELAAACIFCVARHGPDLAGRAAAVTPLVSSSSTLVACIAAYLVPSPLGENIAPLRFAAIPIAVLVLSLRGWRPLPVAAVALSLAALWNLTRSRGASRTASADPAAHARTGRRRSASCTSDSTPSYRVEAVDTSGHWAGRLSAASRHPARARLVPPGRLPAERGALRQARPGRPISPGCAPSASNTSSSPTHRPTTARSRRRASPKRPLGAAPEFRGRAHHGLRGAATAADRDGPAHARGGRRRPGARMLVSLA